MEQLNCQILQFGDIGIQLSIQFDQIQVNLSLFIPYRQGSERI